jgi:hypothetical protein
MGILGRLHLSAWHSHQNASVGYKQIDGAHVIELSQPLRQLCTIAHVYCANSGIGTAGAAFGRHFLQSIGVPPYKSDQSTRSGVFQRQRAT